MMSVPTTENASRKGSAMPRKSLILALTVAFGALCGAPNDGAQGVFALASAGFKGGERLATKMAGNNKSNPNCVGENVSPALAWSNPPEGTKSFAILMFGTE